MIKIDIISGFLGAGKTTFIKKMIDEVFKGEKIALIENEFGEVGIDGGFLKDSGVNITEMNSGCICCSLVGDFGKNLNEVITAYHPDRIIIEPSGVGKLSDVMKSVIDIEKEQDVKLNALVTVVNARKASKQMKAFGEFFNNQIAFATAIVLSRTQNASTEQLELCVKQMQQLNQKAAIITTPWDQISGEQILKVIEGQDSLEMKVLAEETHRREEEEHLREHHHEHHDHDKHEHEHEGHEHHEHDEHGHEHGHHDERDHHHEHDGHGHKHYHEHDGHENEGHEHDHHEHDGHENEGHEHKYHEHDEHGHDHHEEHDHHHEHKEHEGHEHDHDEHVHEHEHEAHEHDHHHGHEGHEHDHHHNHEHCGHEHHHHHADDIFTSWGKETPHKYAKSEIEQVLKALSEDDTYGEVLRAKGMVENTEGGWIYFDMVPGEYEIREGEPDYTGRLCVIGTNIDEHQLEVLFQLA